jgi:hypothetical protein
VWVFLNGVSTTVRSIHRANAHEGGIPLGNGTERLEGGFGFV